MKQLFQKVGWTNKYYIDNSILDQLWRRSIVVITTAQLHSTKPELRFCAGSNPARCVSEICDGEDLWQWSRQEIRLNTFRRSSKRIHQTEAARPSEVLLGKGALKLCSKFTWEHPCWSAISIKLLCIFTIKETLAQVFSCEFCEIFKNAFFDRTALVAASENF